MRVVGLEHLIVGLQGPDSEASHTADQFGYERRLIAYRESPRSSDRVGTDRDEVVRELVFITTPK